MGAGGATEAEMEALIAERTRRQDVLYEPGKRIQLLMARPRCTDGPVRLALSSGSSTRMPVSCLACHVVIAALPALSARSLL